MTALITIAIVITVLAGTLLGVFLRLSLAIRWEDRRRGALRFDAPDSRTRAARSLVGVTSSRWDD